MSPLDWLRSRRQPKYATGGHVAALAPGNAPPVAIDTSCTLTMPTKTPTLPPGVTVTFHPESAPTPELVQQMAEAVGIAPPKPAELPQRIAPSREHTAELTRQANEEARRERVDNNCPCAVIYSKCRCGR